MIQNGTTNLNRYVSYERIFIPFETDLNDNMGDIFQGMIMNVWFSGNELSFFFQSILSHVFRLVDRLVHLMEKRLSF